MSFLNVEIKAHCSNTGFVRDWLLKNKADFKGIDHQTDTYFNVNNGRLKLREGNIENNLIFYNRQDGAGPKFSHFQLVPIPDARGLKEVLEKSIGLKMIVQKKREIYFIGNVKFHIDEISGLGSFIEIEASNLYGEESREKLTEQCRYYMEALQVKREDLVAESYSDMVG